MKHLKKFNEKSLNEALDMNDIKDLTINEILEKYPDIIKINVEHIIEDSGDEKFFEGSDRKIDGNEAYFFMNYNFESMLVFDKFNDEPIAFINEYELSNPFFFENVLVLPGHDSITMFDVKTHNHETFGIR